MLSLSGDNHQCAIVHIRAHVPCQEDVAWAEDVAEESRGEVSAGLFRFRRVYSPEPQGLRQVVGLDGVPIYDSFYDVVVAFVVVGYVLALVRRELPVPRWLGWQAPLGYRVVGLGYEG